MEGSASQGTRATMIPLFRITAGTPGKEDGPGPDKAVTVPLLTQTPTGVPPHPDLSRRPESDPQGENPTLHKEGTSEVEEPTPAPAQARARATAAACEAHLAEDVNPPDNLVGAGT
jgi:hypothetical protein